MIPRTRIPQLSGLLVVVLCDLGLFYFVSMYGALAFAGGIILGIFLSSNPPSPKTTNSHPRTSEYLPKKHLSHEVRTPLAAVVGTIDYLIDNPDKDTIVDSLESLTTSCLNLEAVVLDLLESSIDHDPTLFSSPARTDISRLCSKLAHTIKDKAAEKSLHIHVVLSPDVPSIGILDRVRTYQLLHRILASVLHQLEGTNLNLELSFTRHVELEDSNQQYLDVRIAIPNWRAESLTSSSAHAFIGRLATVLSAAISITNEGEIGKVLVSIPFKAPSNHESNVSVDPVEDAWIVSDNLIFTNHITELLNRLGCKSLAIFDCKTFLNNSSSELDPKYIILDIDSTHQNFASLLGSEDRYPNAKIIPVTDSLDDMARKQLNQRRSRSTLLMPIGLGDLQQRIVTPRALKVRSSPNDKNLRVLVVDDVRLNRIVLAKHLESVGHEVVTACNGEEAISTLSQAGHFIPDDGCNIGELFDIVIMDIDMPVLGGIAAAEQIREREKLLTAAGTIRHVPILAATADAVGNDYDKFILAGMEWFLTKPVDPNRLLQLVEHFGGAPSRNQRSSNKQSDAINLDWLRDQFGGDDEAVAEIIEAFLDEIDSLWLSLFRGAVDGSAGSIRAHAHALKGSLQNVGAQRAAEVAKQVESAAKSGNVSESRELIESLVTQIKTAKECAIRLQSEFSDAKSETIITV